MATLKQDVATKVSTEAAQQFVNDYYNLLNTTRNDIQSFYMEPVVMADGKSMPAIIYNGNVIPDPSTMQHLYKEQMPKTQYVVQSYDAHVLNADYVADGLQEAPQGLGRNMSILLTVSGFVKYGEPRSADAQAFSEAFVLVPNPKRSTNPRGKHSKDWIIQSQTFRRVT